MIIRGLRAVGATVRVLNETDLPDVIAGYQGRTFLFEIKDGSRKPSERRLRPGQQRFFDEWRGGPLAKIETLADAFRELGIEIQG